MKTDELMAALAARYCRPAWAFLPEVRNGTGYLRITRTADALAMSLWPSRGLELHGFEVKASRGDWLQELKDPAKAEGIAAFCDRWWLVVGDKEIVRLGELPPTWGLMVPRGTSLIAVTEAPKLDASPLDRLFVASLLRKVTETWTPQADIAAATDAARAEGQADRAAELEGVRESLDGLRKRVARFERESGVAITGWYSGNVGRAVRDVIERGPEHIRHQIEGHKAWAERIVRDCAAALDASEAQPDDASQRRRDG